VDKFQEQVTCKHCGVVIANIEHMGVCVSSPRGHLSFRYGVQHKEGCPHAKSKKDLINSWFKEVK
jgi:hypothetical protein